MRTTTCSVAFSSRLPRRERRWRRVRPEETSIGARPACLAGAASDANHPTPPTSTKMRAATRPPTPEMARSPGAIGRTRTAISRFQPTLRTGQLADPGQQLAADPHLGPARVASEALGDAAADLLLVEKACRLKARTEVVEVPAEAHRVCGALGDQVVAVIDEELQPAQLRVVGGERQDRFAQRRAGDREGVDRVRLASRPRVAAGAGRKRSRRPLTWRQSSRAKRGGYPSWASSRLQARSSAWPCSVPRRSAHRGVGRSRPRPLRPCGCLCGVDADRDHFWSPP